jgi:hypothetical protein
MDVYSMFTVTREVMRNMTTAPCTMLTSIFWQCSSQESSQCKANIESHFMEIIH